MRRAREAVIAIDETTSGAVDCGAASAVGLFTPSTLTGTAVTFLGAHDEDGTYQAVVDSAGAAVSVTVSASKAIGFSAAVVAALLPWRFLKIVSGATETAARTLYLMTKS